MFDILAKILYKTQCVGTKYKLQMNHVKIIWLIVGAFIIRSLNVNALNECEHIPS